MKTPKKPKAKSTNSKKQKKSNKHRKIWLGILFVSIPLGMIVIFMYAIGLHEHIYWEIRSKKPISQQEAVELILDCKVTYISRYYYEGERISLNTRFRDLGTLTGRDLRTDGSNYSAIVSASHSMVGKCEFGPTIEGDEQYNILQKVNSRENNLFFSVPDASKLPEGWLISVSEDRYTVFENKKSTGGVNTKCYISLSSYESLPTVSEVESSERDNVSTSKRDSNGGRVVESRRKVTIQTLKGEEQIDSQYIQIARNDEYSVESMAVVNNGDKSVRLDVKCEDENAFESAQQALLAIQFSK